MNDFERDFDLLTGHIADKYGFNPDDVMSIINDVIDEYGDSIPFDIIWRTTHELAGFLGGKKIVKWNLLLRELNHYKIIDYGQGIIHPNESAQAIFMTKQDIKVVKVIENNTDDIYIEPILKKDRRRDVAINQMAKIKKLFPNLYKSVHRIKLFKFDRFDGDKQHDQYFDDIVTMFEPLEYMASKGNFKAKEINLAYHSIIHILDGKMSNCLLRMKNIPEKYFQYGITFNNFFIKNTTFENKYFYSFRNNFEFSDTDMIHCNFTGKKNEVLFNRNVSLSLCSFNDIESLTMLYGSHLYKCGIINPAKASFMRNVFDECNIILDRTLVDALKMNKFKNCKVSSSNKMIMSKISRQIV